MRMRVNVVMLAFQPEVQIYPIDILLNDEEQESLNDPNTNGNVVHQVLDKVFMAGNKDSRIHGRLFCSVSCGDVVLLGNDMWLLSRNGWRCLTVEQMAEYCAMERRDRQFCNLMK